MSLFEVNATVNNPFDWPRNYDAGFISKTADIYELQIKNDPELSLVHLPSLYASIPVDYNISISGVDDVTVKSAILTNPPADENISLETLNQTNFRATGTVSSFSGESFRLKLLDNTFITIPVLTEDFDTPSSVVKWTAPGQPWSRTNIYKFKVTYDQDSSDEPPIVNATADFTVTQYVYWNYDPSLQALAVLVERSQA